MATEHPVKVYVETPESRISLGRLVVFGDGTCWDRFTTDANIMFDPATSTAMLAPVCMTPQWQTTFTGDYARYFRTDLIFPTFAKWKVNQILASGDYWYESQGVNEVVKTAANIQANQAMFCSAYLEGITAPAKTIVFECGWGGSVASGQSLISVRLRQNGEYEVWKNGIMVGEYSPVADKTTRKTGGKPQSSNGRFISLLLIPCRYRDLLIIDAQGNTACHTFKDLNPPFETQSDPFQVITPDAPFYVYIPVGKSAFQLHRVRYKTSGAVYSPVQRMRYPMPSWFSTTTRIMGHAIGWRDFANTTVTASVVNPDGSPVTANGTQDLVRLKVQITGTTSDDNYGLYSAWAYSDPTYVTTGGTEIDVTSKVENLRFQVPENGRVTVDISGRKKAWSDLGINRPAVTSNRPFRIAISNGTSEVDIVRGTLSEPEVEYFDGDYSPNNDYALLTFKGQDRSGLYDKIWFQTSYPYDGMYPSDIIKDLITLGGWSATSHASVTTMPVLSSTSIDFTLGKYTLLPERGDTLGKWIDKIWEEYCTTWIKGWRPTSSGYKFWFRDPASLTVTPSITLYTAIADTITAGVTQALRLSRVVRRLVETYERPECNQLQILGQDPHTAELLWGTYNDTESQNPALSPANRPENWLGNIETVLYQDPAIHTLTGLGNVGLMLARRLMPGRILVQWDSDFLVDNTTDVPLWIGDVVRIMEPGGITVKGDYRILSISNVEFIQERNGFKPRRASYVGLDLSTAEMIFNTSNNSQYLFFP